MKKFLEKILSLLRVRLTAAGLEVSDQVVRLVFFDGKAWQMNAVRFEQGVMEGGRIKDRAALLTGLAELRHKALKGDKKKKMNVVVCLSSVETYTQVFSLPAVKGDGLEKAVDLNLLMASPLEKGQAHYGWQIVGQDEGGGKLEILSAFIDHTVVDEMVDLLFEAGFLAMAVESRALALTRVLKDKGAGVDVTKPYIFLNVDNSGIDFLIIRKGALYFEYARSWRDIMNDKGEISPADFELALAASLRQVINFYSQHWTDPLAAIIISAAALEDHIEKVIAESASLPGVQLTLVMGQPISSEWLVGLGCSLRGTSLKTKNLQINLLGDESRDRFHEEQLIQFMRFWRVLIPVALGILVVSFFGTNLFITNTKMAIESRSDFTLNSAQTAEIADLEASATVFNQSVALMQNAESAITPKAIVLSALLAVGKQSSVTVNHVGFISFGSPISISGTSNSETNILAFKTALQADPRFASVDLPLTEIQNQGGSVSFLMTLTFNPAVVATTTAH